MDAAQSSQTRRERGRRERGGGRRGRGEEEKHSRAVVGTPSEWSRESDEAAAPNMGARDTAEAEAPTDDAHDPLCAMVVCACRRVCGQRDYAKGFSK
jgi:hypothetical protein